MNDSVETQSKKEIQPALTIQQQIENLKDLGLIINDAEQAVQFLNDVSYYRFIKAYSLGLKSKNGHYNDGVTFERLSELYRFNAKFRQALFAQIETIEINLRCRLANHFSLAHGAMGYLDASNFENYPTEFSEGIQKEINRNHRSPIIENFQNNYIDGNIPFYAVVEILSFGTLSKFFKNMLLEDKKAISKYYDIPYTYFQSWIESIAYVRNICAHYGRLYNGILIKKPNLYREYVKLGISNNRIMSIIICMKYLLSGDSHWPVFVNTLQELITQYPAVKIETMGFPENWKELLLA